MIEISNVSKDYGTLRAVSDATFSVSEGEVVGLLGPNGAGKTTILRILTGYLPPSQGTARVAGHDVLEQPIKARKEIGYLPELPPVYGNMTVRGYLNFVSEIKRIPRKNAKKCVDDALEMAGLSDVQGRLIQNMSKGYRQRVGIAQAVIGRPKILVFDEPTVGLDPRQIIEIRNLIKELGKDHTIILSSHILPEVSAVCKRIIILNKGRIVASDTQEALQKGSGLGGGVFVSVKGARDAGASFRALESVASVEEQGRDGEAVSLEVAAKPGAGDIREALFHAVVKDGGVLLEMRPIAASLEDIFLQLITREQHEEAEGEKSAEGEEAS